MIVFCCLIVAFLVPKLVAAIVVFGAVVDELVADVIFWGSLPNPGGLRRKMLIQEAADQENSYFDRVRALELELKISSLKV